MQQESAIQAIKNIMKMLNITPEQLQDNTQSTPEQKKEPILVTEDGVVIYDEEKMLYGIQKGILTNHAYWRARNCTEENEAHTYLWFSTSEAKDEYINNHRKMYSLNQIKEAYANLPSINELPSWWEFKQCLQ